MRVAVERKRRPTEEMRSGRVSHLRRSAAPRIGSFLSRAEKWMRCSRHTLLDVLWPSTHGEDVGRNSRAWAWNSTRSFRTHAVRKKPWRDRSFCVFIENAKKGSRKPWAWACEPQSPAAVQLAGNARPRQN